MTAALLLDQVSIYAAAVRAQLADLPADQVEDLTDGLEADLAEALEDTNTALTRPGGPGGPSTDDASVLDLTRRFGPAAEYAAELRAAAGLPAARTDAEAGRQRRSSWDRLRAAVAVPVGALRAGAAAAVGPLLETPVGAWLVGLGGALRPVWWLVRGWMWWVMAVNFGNWNAVTEYRALGGFVPLNVLAGLTLGVAALLSIGVGRGWGSGRRTTRAVTWLASAAAVVLLVPFAGNAQHALRAAMAAPRTQVVYVESPLSRQQTPQDGVVVDGQYVSNLFVYDAQGNPLQDVQVVDDRGRAVRTTTDRGQADWALPGVDGTWAFAPATDVDGRERWNVYPLRGAPTQSWTSLDDGFREPADGTSLRTPPAPFAKAPALVGATDEQGATGTPGTADTGTAGLTTAGG
jgi:hypothetical protein